MKNTINPNHTGSGEDKRNLEATARGGAAAETSAAREPFVSAETILVPVDFSESARQAAEYAADLAAAPNGTVWLLHVLNSPSFVQDLNSAIEADSDDVITNRACAALERYSEPIRARGINVRFLTRTGNVPVEISDAAGQLNADLIVMPTRGLGASSRMTGLGTAERVARTAPCPVLSLRRKFLKDRARGRVSHGSRQQRLLVPVDFSETAARTLQYTMRLAERTGAKVLLLHVARVPRPSVRAAASDVNELSADVIRAAEKQLADWAWRNADARASMDLVVRSSHNPAQAVEDLARRMNPDLIVVGADKRSWLKRLLKGSITQNLVRHVRTPVLCLNHQAATRLNEKTAPARMEPHLAMRPAIS